MYLMVPFVMVPVRKRYILPGNACILFFQRAYRILSYKMSSAQDVTVRLILASKLQHCEANGRGFGRFVMVQLERGIQLLCLGQLVNLQLWLNLF